MTGTHFVSTMIGLDNPRNAMAGPFVRLTPRVPPPLVRAVGGRFGEPVGMSRSGTQWTSGQRLGEAPESGRRTMRGPFY